MCNTGRGTIVEAVTPPTRPEAVDTLILGFPGSKTV